MVLYELIGDYTFYTIKAQLARKIVRFMGG